MKCAACAHSRALHSHYRSGTECAVCWCPKFTAPLWKLLLDALQRRFRRV